MDPLILFINCNVPADAHRGDPHHECVRRETKPREVHPWSPQRRHEWRTGRD